MNQVIRSFHHAQPTTQAVQLISPADFYRKLLAHDWYYAWSDDSTVYRAGQIAHALLVQLANNAGPVQKWLFSEVSKHYSTGDCLLYTSPSPRDKRQSRMPSSA